MCRTNVKLLVTFVDAELVVCMPTKTQVFGCLEFCESWSSRKLPKFKFEEKWLERHADNTKLERRWPNKGWLLEGQPLCPKTAPKH